MNIILQTPRMILRELEDGDLDFVAAMLGDEEVMRYFPAPLDRDGAVAWIERQRGRYREHGYGLWLAVDREGGEPIGQVGLTPPRPEGTVDDDLGYLIHRPYWRRGLAAEGAEAVRNHAFEVLGRRRLLALIRPENGPSQGVAIKVGMAREPGRIVTINGVDCWVYAADRP